MFLPCISKFEKNIFLRFVYLEYTLFPCKVTYNTPLTGMYEKHLLHLLGNYLLYYLLSSCHINLQDSETDFVFCCCLKNLKIPEKFSDNLTQLW